MKHLIPDPGSSSTLRRESFRTDSFTARDANKPGVIQTAYGLLDPNPTAGELLPRNYGRGPGQVSMNLRLTKTIGFGRTKEQARAGGSGVANAGAAAAAATGRGLGGIIGTPTTSPSV